MTLDEMRAFVRVAELGSFTKAAVATDSHTSRLSTLVRDLEEALGVELLVRSTRSLRVTAKGREVLKKAKGILAAVDDLMSASRDSNGDLEGHLRITAAGDYGLLKGYAEAHPKVRLTVHYETANIDIVTSDFDLALRLGPLLSSSLVAQRLGNIHFGLFAAPEYLARAGTPQSPADLDCADWLRLDRKSHRPLSYRWNGELAFMDAEPRISFNDVAGLRDGALQGLGIARLAIVVAAPWLGLQRLAVVLPTAEFEPAPLFGVHAGRRRAPRLVRSFMEYAARAIGRS